MRRLLVLIVSSLLSIGVCRAQEQSVHFASIGGPHAATLEGRLFRAPGEGRHPAVVFLHGCGGLFDRHGAINARERDWADRMNVAGVSVLMVDSLGPRQHGEMCAPAHFDAGIYRARAFDAYAALRFLQAQDFVLVHEVGLMGWSQGGGTLLNAIRADSAARPDALPDGDFNSAVAFYPASCSIQRQGSTWASPVPLLVLVGAGDVWTVAEPCRELIEHHDASTNAEIHVYPGAFHDFDWPNLPVHEVPAFRTRAGVIPIEGGDPEAKADAVRRVSAFFGAHLKN